MRFRGLIGGMWVFLLASCLTGTAQVAQAEPVAKVTGVRIGQHGDTTRFVLDISSDVSFRVFTLPDPYRVVVDFPELDWDIPLPKDGDGNAFISRYRFGLFQPGTSRLVLDTKSPVIVEKQFILQPQARFAYRFVLDLRPSTVGEFMDARDKAAPPPSPRPLPPIAEKPKRPDGKRVVVIDAGHGGVDPGTISRRGPREKDVTLEAAKVLKSKLERTGKYEVKLTRDRDIFIPLRERVEIGRRQHADLFISLHADSISDHRVRGATVYTLSETSSDKEAAALARKENKADVIAGMDLEGEDALLTNILIDLAQRETMNYSAEFASMIVPELKRRVLVRQNSHRFAGFRVLKAPDVPSVLVEMGYLSNNDDTKLLTSRAGIEKIADALTAAVGAYFDAHDARLATQ